MTTRKALSKKTRFEVSPIDELKDIARGESNWSGWQTAMHTLLNDLDLGDGPESPS